MASPLEVLDETWNADFVRALRRGLATLEEQGALAVERAEIASGEVITVLRFGGALPRWNGEEPARPPIRHGRVASVSWLRPLFVPDAPGGVADAWLHTIYPPDHPDPATLHDGVHWFRGRAPGMSSAGIDELAPPLRPLPPPRWQDDLPPGVNPDTVSFTASYEPPSNYRRPTP